MDSKKATLLTAASFIAIGLIGYANDYKALLITGVGGGIWLALRVTTPRKK